MWRTRTGVRRCGVAHASDVAECWCELNASFVRFRVRVWLDNRHRSSRCRVRVRAQLVACTSCRPNVCARVQRRRR